MPKHAITTTAAKETDTTLIAAPGANKRIKVLAFYVSADTSVTVSFEHGTTLMHRQYVAANGGQIPAFAGRPGDAQNWLWSTPPNTSVTYTTSTTSNAVVEAWYDIAGA